MWPDSKRFIVGLETILVIFVFAIAVVPRAEVLGQFQRDAAASDDYCYASKDAKEHQSTKDCQGFLYKTMDDPVALFTGGLLVATIALFVATYWLFRVAAHESGKADEAMAIARASADAAKKSADAAVYVQLPIIDLAEFLIIRIDNLKSTTGDEIKGGLDLPENIGLVVNYANIGNGNAELIEQCADWVVCEVLPEKPEYKKKTHFSPGQKLRPNKTSGSLVGNNFSLSSEQRQSIKTGTAFLWVYCYLKYEDFIGDVHTRRFCGKWLGVQPHFGTEMSFVYDSKTPKAYTESY